MIWRRIQCRPSILVADGELGKVVANDLSGRLDLNLV